MNSKRTLGAAQLTVWLVIGAAALAFLQWQNDDIDGDSIVPIPFLLDSAAAPGTFESFPKPFARLKAPITLAPRKDPAPPSPTKLRAEPGQPVPVSITAYCLKGRTRMGTGVREGVVAADPRVFPLTSEIDVIVGKDTLGRFRVEDTGFLIKGRKLDIWLSDCSEARAFGRKRGQATLASKSLR
ncbi:MAG: 3D domain-containing protein [Gemmatimonadaceae bacterium]